MRASRCEHVFSVGEAMGCTYPLLTGLEGSIRYTHDHIIKSVINAYVAFPSIGAAILSSLTNTSLHKATKLQI
jgi:hypothetical protein